jgi:hypothetical protein
LEAFAPTGTRGWKKLNDLRWAQALLATSLAFSQVPGFFRKLGLSSKGGIGRGWLIGIGRILIQFGLKLFHTGLKQDELLTQHAVFFSEGTVFFQ